MANTTQTQHPADTATAAFIRRHGGATSIETSPPLICTFCVFQTTTELNWLLLLPELLSFPLERTVWWRGTAVKIFKMQHALRPPSTVTHYGLVPHTTPLQITLFSPTALSSNLQGISRSCRERITKCFAINLKKCLDALDSRRSLFFLSGMTKDTLHYWGMALTTASTCGRWGNCE